MVRVGGGRPNGAAEKIFAVLGAAALGNTRSAAATTVATNCPPMDLVNHNITDYIRWSTMSDRLYLENGACATMTDIYESRIDTYTGENKGPVYPFDETTGGITNNVTGSWYLGSSLYVTEGARLVVQGLSKGGDCDHLLLASSSEKFINVRAHGGEIMLDGTHVESWDLLEGTVDENYDDGRSYLSAISEVIVDPAMECEGMANNDMGEARMDIIDSEINHLGHYESESYGIAYKVRGFCTDLSNPELFETVGVTGDILGSHIHHLYFGHYSYGHQGGNWSYNTVHDNVGYGFDPHDDSDYVTISNNEVYNNGWHGIIASKRCDHVTIENNHVYDNGHVTDAGKMTGNGIMLHRSCDYATVRGNVVENSMDSGVAVYESSNCEISQNNLSRNKNGIRMSMGSSNNLAFENHIVINGEDEKYAIYLYRGNDTPAVEGSDGRPRNNRIFDNSLMSDNAVVMARNADDNIIEGNTIFGRESRFVDSFNTLWYGNSVPDLHELKLEDDSCFDPESDMDYVAGEAGGGEGDGSWSSTLSYSYDFGYEYEEGFFCGV
ncbi:unnamed protein product [Ectocarpus sp. 12 AP-2014]